MTAIIDKVRSAVRALRALLNGHLRMLERNASRQTLKGALEYARNLGFNPQTVIDVGADRGTFELYETFPNASHILIEPLEENRPYLEQIVAKLKNAQFFIAAATEEAGSVTINVHPDFCGSSLYLECEESDVNGVPRTVPSLTLDDLARQFDLQGPILVKIDVQGAELDVLRGAADILKITEFVIVEASFFGFFVNGPLCHDIVVFMKERGFVLYDILNHMYRPLDDALSQVDLVFVREGGSFRKYQFYATKEQRDAQNRTFRSVRNT